jgi:hypothetical protein
MVPIGILRDGLFRLKGNVSGDSFDKRSAAAASLWTVN